MDKILKFVEKEDKRLRQKFNYSDEDKRTLARAVKLNEEVGELCSEVLTSISLQRQEKLSKHEKENVSHEIADVLICTLMLARSLRVDVKKALKNKIKKINSRYAKN